MKIIKTQKDNDGVNNFILVDGKTIKIFINDFKTKNKYELLTYTYNKNNNDEKELKRLIEKWISINGLVFGDYIFGKSSTPVNCWYISESKNNLSDTKPTMGCNL